MSYRVQKNTRDSGRYLLLALIAGLGCTPATLAESDDEESPFSIQGKRLLPPNNPIDGNNKIGVRVSHCDYVPLRYSPGGEIIGERSFERGRLLLVQQAPGLIKGIDEKYYVWADDLNGVGNDEFQSHFKSLGISLDDYWNTRTGRKDAQFNYRGWILSSCLESVESHPSRMGLPTNTEPNPGLNSSVFPNSSGVAIAYKMRPNCQISDQLYFKKNSKYTTYGSNLVPNKDALYISFNTPGACSNAKTIEDCVKTAGGGGMSFGYLRTGSVFYAHWSFNDPVANDIKQASWLYGYGSVNNLEPGRLGTWGWVWAGCMEIVLPSAPTMTPPSLPQGANPPGSDVPNLPPPAPPVLPAGTPPGICRIRCCDVSYHETSASDAAACRNQYPVCASRGKAARMTFQPAGSSLIQPVYERPGGCN